MKNKKLTLIIPFFNEKQKIVQSMKIISIKYLNQTKLFLLTTLLQTIHDIKLKLFIKSINLKFKNNIKIINNKKSLPSLQKI